VQRIISVDFLRGDAGLPEQRAFAAILDCSDARAPAELIFNEGPNELFVVRLNLRTAADIAGTYSAVSAGVAVAGGAKVATLQNSNGVVLQLQGKQVGFEAALSLGVMTISLQ